MPRKKDLGKKGNDLDAMTIFGENIVILPVKGNTNDFEESEQIINKGEVLKIGKGVSIDLGVGETVYYSPYMQVELKDYGWMVILEKNVLLKLGDKE